MELWDFDDVFWILTSLYLKHLVVDFKSEEGYPCFLLFVTCTLLDLHYLLNKLPTWGSPHSSFHIWLETYLPFSLMTATNLVLALITLQKKQFVLELLPKYFTSASYIKILLSIFDVSG